MRSYIELTKPRITWLILMSVAVGYYFGLRGGEWRWLVLAHTLLGTGLLASGAATLNEWYEREGDAKMHRTRMRPIPSGRVSPVRALIFGVTISAIGFLDLALTVNPLAAFPGAMPPLIGYAAAAGALHAEAWILFAILFLWQFPHFLSIAWFYREDYDRAGIRTLPVVSPDGKATAAQIVLCSVLLLPVSMAPGYLEMSGKVYVFGALALGLVFLYTGLRVAFQRTNLRARHVLLASVFYLPALYGLMLLDRPW